MLITVIEIGNGADDIGLRITRARNHQNVVRGVDFAALDPNLPKAPPPKGQQALFPEDVGK